MTAERASALSRFVGLRTLHIVSCVLCDAHGMASLAALTSLTRLELKFNCCDLPDEQLARMFPDNNQDGIGAAVGASIAALTSLAVLSVDGVVIGDDGAASLAALTN